MRTFESPRDIILPFSLFCFSFVYQLFYIRFGLNMLDGGILLTSAERALNGEISMVDFFGYPPGKSFYVSLFFKFFGVSIAVERLAMVLLFSLSIVLLYGLSRHVLPFPYVLYPSLFLMCTPTGYHSRFIGFFTLLNLFLIFRYIRSYRQTWLIIATFSAGLSLYFRQDVAFFSVLTLATVLLFQNRFQWEIKGKQTGEPIAAKKEFLVVLMVLLSTLSPTFVYLFLHPEFMNEIFGHLKSMWGFNKTITLVTPPNFWDHVWAAPVHKKRRFFEFMVFYYPLALYGISFLFVVLKPLYKKTRINGYLFVLTVYGGQTLAYPLSFPDFWHAITIYSPVYLLSVYYFYSFFVERQTKSHLWQVSKVSFYREGGIKVFLPLALVFYFWITYAYFGIVLGGIGAIRGEHALLTNERASIFLPVEKHIMFENVIKYIDKNSLAKDGLFVVPHEAAWYFLLNRKNPTGYDYLMPGHMNQVAQEQIVRDLKKKPPKFVLFQNTSLLDKEETRLKNFAPTLNSYILNQYIQVKRFGEYDVLIDKQGGSESAALLQ